MSASNTGPAPRRSLGVKRHLIFTSVVMAVRCIGVVGWAGQAKLSGAIIAQGSVVVDRNVKKVQHSLGGIVAEIAVKNGDAVEAGDLLLRLDATQIKSEIGVIRSQLIELTARGDRGPSRAGTNERRPPELLAGHGIRQCGDELAEEWALPRDHRVRPLCGVSPPCVVS